MGKSKSGIELYAAASRIERRRNPGGNAAPSSPAGQAEGTEPDAAGEKESLPKGGFLKVTGDGAPGAAGKAAGLLLLLGEEQAAAVMSKLSPDEAERVAGRIASTRRIDTVEAREILEEFGDRFKGVEARRVRGGVEAARSILAAAFGNEKADEIVARAVPEASPRPFAFLGDLSSNQLSALLRKENPTTLSLVMAYLDPLKSSRVLEALPDDERAAVVLRMARTEKVSKEVVETVEKTLQEKLRLIGKDDSEEMDGRSALADILRYMDLGDERRLLEELEEADPALADQVREKLHTMDTVLHMRKRDLQDLLSGMTEREIAMILKGQPEEIKDAIGSCLSSRRRLLVADEGDIIGPVPRTEADAAVKAFLERLEEGEENGTYVIMREEEDLI